MSAKAAINKEVFVPHDEKMLAAVQVKRKTKKKIPFLATGGQGDYLTFICLAVTNKKPAHVTITKVKQFQGSSGFVKRSQWTIDQLRQVNGIDSDKDSPEFDLTFDNALDQWIAGSAGEKCTFVQILHHTCQRYIPMRKPEFVNCQSKLLGEVQAVDSVVVRCKVFMNRVRKDLVAHHSHLTRRGNSILHSAADSVTSAVQKASQALNERGERLGRAEERTADMMNSAEQFSVTAHKLAMKHKC
ncbi:syntaxin-binding protein 6 isoform X1 [Phyllopteryx taeniolatus]|uniref:syntaxin-binding protein 6 isoform X1 n=1 Tax=Phyllopteryx taeniolatus TaxID=161469 RepID=UPI002AD41359|nr:syntaxin-binding protein 6 isoform X1 [Phyllopteryx taeniolatus]XP_061651642.1 syntaxin-binding protein 6 isoform X1 [Phyllopteryx taeniolatus]XP_061651643.1 syntaxin-binding protein 6 isoform X1 [Phyllopteryx taeniolatus]XP_061651644.1 syntaxin-binding protein 6 isoform X1 [Phyllopteryx taeniolatus]XP_061651646.1 syntaxin-binding protein 6 isoform X1 [Phyllopteryx taeniolatus]